MDFCENRGSVRAAVGLGPTVTYKIRAGASANLLVSIISTKFEVADKYALYYSHNHAHSLY